MRWLADECVHAAVVRELRNAGHDVLSATDVPQRSDQTLITAASADGRILLTDDKDFGEIVFREGRATSGIVLIRIAPSRWRSIWPMLSAAIVEHGKGLSARFTVLEENRIRSIPLQSA